MILYTIALVVHIIICVALVLVILAQTSKGGLDASLGGAAMNVFGGSGASKFLRKWTQILGVIFVVSCLFMVFQVKGQKGGVPQALKGQFGTTQKAPTKATGDAAKTNTTKPATADKK